MCVVLLLLRVVFLHDFARMPNVMPEDLENECGDTDSQRPGIRTCDQSSVSLEIRNDPFCKSHHESSFAGLSSATDKNEAFPSANADEKTKAQFSADECPRLPEIGCSNIREYDYIGFSEASATGGNKLEDENCTKLGPKTKETELRLGFPEDEELVGGANVAGSNRKTDAKSSTIQVKELTPRLDLSSVQRGKSDEHGPQRDSILEREGRFVNRQEISGYNSFAFPKKASNSVEEAGQVKLEDSPTISSTKDLRLPMRPGAYDSRFIQSSEPQKYWPKSLNSPEFSQVVQDYNYRAFHAASKGNASGAKRGFSDVLGVNLMHDSGFGLPELDSKVLNEGQPRPFVFPWAVTQQYASANAWQMNWEQKNKQNFQQYPRAIMPNGIPDEKTSNRLVEPVISNTNAQSVGKASNESQKLPAPVATTEKIQNPPETERAPTQNGTTPRAPPVVGWPPIRSFRKNLAGQPKVAAAPPCNPPPPVADPGEKKINTMFVKVNVDGVPIGRKIDLKAYDSYEKLSVALDEMFRGSINAAQTADASPLAENNNNQGSLLNGSDYVFVYEDNEGDRMLVGDVPWEMFVNTVKRLRVMRSSDAGRLANRTQ